ncbi:DUF2239 family protein, partial [Burkholderia pseudomallei]|nr:DUF2239 family protein [Burkholderia pseudomallei]
MTSFALPSHIAFDGYRRLAAGPLPTVALAVKRAIANDAIGGALLIFDNATGRSIDIDTRGSDDEVAARYAPAASADIAPGAAAGAHRERAADLA